MASPRTAFVGVKLVIYGAVVVSVKLLDVSKVELPMVTALGPTPAPEGTVAANWASEVTLDAATTPLNFTIGAPAVKLSPSTTTEVPAGPMVGEKSVTSGP